MDKKTQRLRRAAKTRAKVRASGKARLCVFRTPRHIYAQIISADGDKVLAACSTVEKELKGSSDYSGNVASASIVGKLIAERSLAAGVDQVAFDRAGFHYHGRVKALADSAREAGLKF